MLKRLLKAILFIPAVYVLFGAVIIDGIIWIYEGHNRERVKKVDKFFSFWEKFLSTKK